MNLELSQRKAIISGANRGIGRSIAFAYAAEGVHLALLGRNKAACAELADEIAKKHPHVTCAPVYVDFEEEATANLKDKWERWGAGIQLVVLPSPYRELTRPLLRHIHRLARENGNEIITVVLPEFVPARWWHHLFHNQNALLIKGALLFKPNTVVTSVPFHLQE